MVHYLKEIPISEAVIKDFTYFLSNVFILAVILNFSIKSRKIKQGPLSIFELVWAVTVGVFCYRTKEHIRKACKYQSCVKFPP